MAVVMSHGCDGYATRDGWGRRNCKIKNEIHSSLEENRSKCGGFVLVSLLTYCPKSGENEKVRKQSCVGVATDKGTNYQLTNPSHKSTT